MKYWARGFWLFIYKKQFLLFVTHLRDDQKLQAATTIHIAILNFHDIIINNNLNFLNRAPL